MTVLEPSFMAGSFPSAGVSSEPVTSAGIVFLSALAVPTLIQLLRLSADSRERLHRTERPTGDMDSKLGEYA